MAASRRNVVAWIAQCLLCYCTLSGQAADLSTVAADLQVPPTEAGLPAAGRRVKQVLPGYDETNVYHVLYLPSDFQVGERYPLIVEYGGNGDYRNAYGDECHGRPEESCLGYGMTAGAGCLWVCLPYLSADGRSNVTKWWGDPPDYAVRPTVDYCRRAIPWICEQYGGNPAQVFLAGFSRGAIACNFVGLHDDQAARLWRGFVVYSHYDGVRRWGYAGGDPAAAQTRLRRLAGRPQFVCHEQVAAGRGGLQATQSYLTSSGIRGNWTFHETGFRNHNDRWVLRPSPARQALRKWFRDVLNDP